MVETTTITRLITYLNQRQQPRLLSSVNKMTHFLIVNKQLFTQSRIGRCINATLHPSSKTCACPSRGGNRGQQHQLFQKFFKNGIKENERVHK